MKHSSRVQYRIDREPLCIPIQHGNPQGVNKASKYRKVEMRIILLMILLAAASNNAMAGWVKVGGNDADTLYAEPTSVIKSAYKVKMQSLHDFKMAMKVAGDTFLSTVVQEEYDCKEKLSRALYYSFHSRNLGKGRKVYSDTNTHQWEPVRPSSARETLWKFACK